MSSRRRRRRRGRRRGARLAAPPQSSFPVHTRWRRKKGKKKKTADTEHRTEDTITKGTHADPERPFCGQDGWCGRVIPWWESPGPRCLSWAWPLQPLFQPVNGAGLRASMETLKRRNESTIDPQSHGAGGDAGKTPYTSAKLRVGLC